MNRDGSGRLGSARGSRAGEGGPPSRTFLRTGTSLRLDLSGSSFRRAAETSTRAACAPQIAAERSMHI
jgi:hypothetical protein